MRRHCPHDQAHAGSRIAAIDDGIGLAKAPHAHAVNAPIARSMLGDDCAKCAHGLGRIQHVIPLKQAFDRGGADAERP